MLFCGGKDPLQTFPVYLFGGILLSLLFVPSIADKWGRRDIYSFCLLLSVAGQFGLLMVESYEYALICMGIIGFSFPGKSYLGLLYILEFRNAKSHLRYLALVALGTVSVLCFLPNFY
jgi:Na+/melibiose symporter-like transporter